MASKPQN